MNKQKKYKIDEEMRKLNLVNYKRTLKEIPDMLSIASNTFHNYRKMAIDDKGDIPYEAVRKMEHFFGLKQGELANFTITCKTLRQIIKEENKIKRPTIDSKTD
jgi:hypothetical protein